MDKDFLEDAFLAVGSEISVFGNHDDNPHTGTSWVCYVLIALYVICNLFLLPYLVKSFPDPFLLAQATQTAPPEATEMYHFSKDVTVLYAVYLPSGLPLLSWHNAMTVFLSLLVVPSVFQVILGVFVLGVFGDNIEYALGRGRFIGFYILTGLVSLFLTALCVGASAAPLCAAIGSIAAIMGGYVRLFPHIRFNVYHYLFTFSLLRAKIFQISVKTYVAFLLIGTIIFTWLSTSFAAFGPACLLPVAGFLLGYVLIPYFQDKNVSLQEDVIPGVPLPAPAEPRKDFSYYTGSGDPTDRPGPAQNPFVTDANGDIEFKRFE